MYYQKKGIPEENELVLCTITKILPHSVFVTLDEYENKEAMVHISEVSPGRIRNIRDFVREGKKIVCKVLRINREKGHIDLSLRRVSIPQRAKKLTEYKQEEKSEKLIEALVKEEKISMKEFYDDLGYDLISQYGSLTAFFDSILQDNDLEKKIKNPLAVKLIKRVREKIKPQEVKLQAKIKLSSKAQDGIAKIKEAFKKAKAFAAENKYSIEVTYVSAPNYSLQVTSQDYKKAEKVLQEVADNLVNAAKSLGCEAEWQKKS